MTRIVDLIRRKRDGEEVTFEEFEHLISSYARGEIKDYQMAAFLVRDPAAASATPKRPPLHRPC